MSMGNVMKEVLETKVNKEAQVLDYGNKEDFCKVWRDGFEVDKPVILIWDGQNSWEEDQGNFLTPHLTPLDWALAFSIKVLNNSGGIDLNTFRIHIVDLTAADHDTWSMRMRHQLLAEMPWLSLHAPLIPEGKRYRKGYLPIITIEEGKNGLLVQNGSDEWVLRSQLIDEAAPSPVQPTRDTLKYIAGQWTSTIVRSHDHHDLNNILGPLLITGRPQFEDLIRNAFLLRLKWSELSQAADIERNDEHNFSGFEERVDILVIDDNIKRGWGFVLTDILGLNYEDNEEDNAIDTPRILSSGDENCNLYGIENPGFLKKYLKKNRYYKKRSYDSPLNNTPDNNKDPWILVLDIYLLVGDDEIKWIKRLLKIAKKVAKDNHHLLAWPGFSEEDIEELQEWLKAPQDRNIRAYDLALSLLPRLCALRWPAVPILIFSGTHRRNLIEMFQQYGNIVLAPSKPTLLGNDTIKNEAWRFVDGWRAEFEAGKQLVETQRKLIRLTKMEKPEITQKNERHIVIALDETGPPNDAPTHIGGVILVSDSCEENTAKENSFLAQEELRKNDSNLDVVHYYNFLPYYFETGGIAQGGTARAPLSKIEHCKDAVYRLPAHHTKLGALRIAIPKPEPANNTNNYDTYHDLFYLRGLSDILELCLAEHLPSIGYDMKKTSISVWLPSKQGYSQDKTANKREAIKYDLKIHLFENGSAVETIGGHGNAYAVLLRAIGERTCFMPIQNSLTIAATRKIPYFSDRGNYKTASEWYCPQCKVVSRGIYAETNQNAPRAPTCPVCRRMTTVAQYSVTQHLADKYVTGEENLFENGGYTYDPSISFDIDTKDESVRNFLVCARSFDSNGKADLKAFKLAYENDFFFKPEIIEKVVAPPNSNHVKNGIATRLIGELSEYAMELSGNEIIELGR